MSILHKRSAKIITAIVTPLLLVALWWLALRPPTVDEVAQQTAQALEKGDVETLLRLTLPEEREKLHLTPEGVRGMLTETLYSHGMPGKLTVKCVQDNLVDQWLYELRPADGNVRHLRYPWPIMLTQRPNGRWYLPLGYLLLTSCALQEEPQDVLDTNKRFWKLADRFGILGVRLNTQGYAMRSTPIH